MKKGVIVSQRCFVMAGILMAVMLLFVPSTLATDRVTATTEGRTILLRGRPFFPVIAWRQCVVDAEQNLAIGINVFMGTSCNQQQLAESVAGRAYVVPEHAYFADTEFPFLIGYHLQDEPDGNGIFPDDLPKTRRVEETGRLIFLTVTSQFTGGDAALPERYRSYADEVDVIGFALYPLAHHCGNDDPWGRLGAVYDAQKILVRLVSPRPIFQWIETNGLEGLCSENSLTPDVVRAEVWLAIAGGATGLGYFTHGWPEGQWKRFHVSNDIADEIAATNREIQKLAPVLLAPQLSFFSRADSPVKVGMRVYGNEIYLIAVNSSADEVTWKQKVPTGRGQAVSVYGEQHLLRFHNGFLEDHFEPYAVRIYRWTYGGVKRRSLP